MRLTSRVLSTLSLALATPSLAIGPWLVCDTNEFVEKLWPTYAAAHAAAVAALRNDAPPDAWRGHRYLMCSTDFGALAGAPGVELVLGGDALDTFHHLVTAPHLFISFSTFGLAAAVLATQAKIYTAPVGDFASQLAGCWGECDCPEVRRKLTGPHGWPCCGPPPDARAFLARHDPWARFGLEAPHA